MKKKKLPFTCYPGNEWMLAIITELGSETTIPCVHGFVRGALANPVALDPGLALKRVFKDADLSSLSPRSMEKLSLAFQYLWNDTAESFKEVRIFPDALLPSRQKGERPFLAAAVELNDGFRAGFSVKKIPPEVTFPHARPWLRNMANEAKWCRYRLQHPSILEQEFPSDVQREAAARNALSWIEECMGWAALYARMDVVGSPKK